LLKPSAGIKPQKAFCFFNIHQTKSPKKAERKEIGEIHQMD
jgi:hypothetical protein